MSKIDSNDLVLLPISSKKLLVGHRAGSQLPDVRSFNKAAAVCSHTFFISACCSDELKTLSERIGERTKATVSDAITTALNEMRAKPHLVAHQPEGFSEGTETVSSDATRAIAVDNGEETRGAERVSCIVTFIECADQETAQKIANAVELVVSEMPYPVPFGRLDRIIFAGDYAAALRDLERGFSGAHPLVPTDSEFGTGVAMAPIVIRDGKVKVCVVMQGWLGHGLVADDRDAQTIAVHTLANQLAHVVCTDMFDQVFPGVLLTPMDGWEAWLYGYAYEAWTVYFAARLSAQYNPTAGSGYRDIFLAIFNRTQEDVPRERFAYRFHGDLDRFLKLAIAAVGGLIIYGATLIGHYDGIGESHYDDERNLTQALEKSGLGGWFEVLRRDLTRLFERCGEWESVQEFVTLNRHIERLLWQFGVFPVRDEQNIRVEIPLVTDAARLLNHVNGKPVPDPS